MLAQKNVTPSIKMLTNLRRTTVNSLVSEHPQELEKVSVIRTVCLQELFSKTNIRNIGWISSQEGVLWWTLKLMTNKSTACFSADKWRFDKQISRSYFC